MCHKIQALRSSIDQNMEQVERGIFHGDYVRVNRQTAQPQPTTRWQFTV